MSITASSSLMHNPDRCHRPCHVRPMDIASIQQQLDKFAKEREWERFHNPKNLSIALAVEAGELLERFQWLTDEESRTIAERADDYDAVRDELADVLIYAIRLADKLNLDLEQAVADKMRRNAEKYPVDLARGNAVKYNRRKAGRRVG